MGVGFVTQFGLVVYAWASATNDAHDADDLQAIALWDAQTLARMVFVLHQDGLDMLDGLLGSKF